MPGYVVFHKVSPAFMEHGSYYSLIYISIIPASFNKKNNLFASKFDLILKKKLLNCYILSRALYGVGTWTYCKVDQK